MIVEFIRSSLNEVLSSISLIVGLTMIIFSATCHEKQRDNFLKISGVALVISLAFFSNTTTIYVFAIFIVASLITKLDFLENIASIFRGEAKSVYDYKKSSLNEKERSAKIEDEIKEEKEIEYLGTIGDKISGDKIPKITYVPQPTVEIKRVNEYERIEQLTLDYISKELGEIDRYVRIMHNRDTVEFDAVKKGKRKDDIIIEVKYTSNIQLIRTLIPKLNLQLQKYTLITGREAILYLYIVSDILYSRKAELFASIEDIEKRFNCKVFILSKIEIGIKE